MNRTVKYHNELNSVSMRVWTAEEFKEKFSVPESYNISSINRAIIKPIMNELQPYFKNLKVKKIKANARGTPVIGYEFTWKPEKTGKYIEGKYEKHSEESVIIQKEVLIFDYLKPEE